MHEAQCALERYNREEVLKLDARATALFSGGLGVDAVEIARQVDFVLYEYGGLADHRINGLSDSISEKIVSQRDAWHTLLNGATEYSFGMIDWQYESPRAIHFDCFGDLRKQGNVAQTRCLTKFLHLLRPQAFIVQDRWIGRGLGVAVEDAGGVNAYGAFVEGFLSFVKAHQDIIPVLRKTESQRSWSDIKLVDKILLCRRAADTKYRLAA